MARLDHIDDVVVRNEKSSLGFKIIVGHTLMDMRTDLIAVPHAGLGFHFLRVPVGNHRILEVLKGKVAQSARSRSAGRST